VDTADSSIVLQAPNHVVNGYVNGVQTITATTPGIIQDSTYYVSVTTSQPAARALRGLSSPSCHSRQSSPASAPTSGGSNTAITVTEIGFVGRGGGGTTVQLVPTSGNGSTV